MSYLTQIVLKSGLGNPGNVLLTAEPAFDTSWGYLYVGQGVGNTPVEFYPTGVVDSLLSGKANTGDLAYIADNWYSE